MSVSVKVTSSAQFFKNVSTDIIQLRVFLAFPLSLIVVQYLYKLGVQLEACYIQSQLDRSLSDHFRAFHSFGPILVKIDPNLILKSPACYPMCVDSLFSVLRCLDHHCGVHMHCSSLSSLKAVLALQTEILSSILPQTLTIACTYHGDCSCYIQYPQYEDLLKSSILRVHHTAIL